MKLYRVRRDLPTYYAGAIGEYRDSGLYPWACSPPFGQVILLIKGGLRYLRLSELEEVDAASEAEYRLTGNWWAGK